MACVLISLRSETYQVDLVIADRERLVTATDRSLNIEVVGFVAVLVSSGLHQSLVGKPLSDTFGHLRIIGLEIGILAFVTFERFRIEL